MEATEKSHRLITIGDLADAAGHMMVVPFGERIATSLADQAFELLGELVAGRHHGHHDIPESSDRLERLETKIDQLIEQGGSNTLLLQEIRDSIVSGPAETLKLTAGPVQEQP